MKLTADKRDNTIGITSKDGFDFISCGDYNATEILAELETILKQPLKKMEIKAPFTTKGKIEIKMIKGYRLNNTDYFIQEQIINGKKYWSLTHYPSGLTIVSYTHDTRERAKIEIIKHHMRMKRVNLKAEQIINL